MTRRIKNRLILSVKNILSDKLFLALFSVLVLFLLLLYGLLPFLQSHLLVLGYIQCVSVFPGQFLSFSCPLVGGETGGILPTGSPIYILGGIIKALLHVPADWALFIVSVAFVGVSLFGAYKLIESFDVNKYIALIFGFVYLSSAGVVNLHNFGGTFWGFIFLPIALFLVKYFLDKIPGTSLKFKAIILISWILLFTFQLFLDGYSFFMTVIASAIILFFWSWRNKWFITETVFAVFTLFFATGIAYLTYTNSVVSSASWASISLSRFRAAGVDIATLFMPSDHVWWASLLNIQFDPAQFWGDGSNTANNYLGYTLVFLAIFGVYITLRTKDLSKKINTISVVCILLVSFVFSLGPSLKWNSIKGPEFKNTSYYKMPADAALLNLPTSKLYKEIPGLSSMRATYRWHRLMHLMLIVLAAIATQAILRRKGYKYATPVLIFVILELSLNPVKVMSKDAEQNNWINNFNTKVINPLSENLEKNESVLFYPSRGNDYLVNYIAPYVHINTYNIGNDKALRYAKPHRPADIKKLLTLKRENKNKDREIILEILNNKTVDAIVVPHFELRWSSYNDPVQFEKSKSEAKAIISRLKSDNKKLSVQDYEQFTIVRIQN